MNNPLISCKRWIGTLLVSLAILAGPAIATTYTDNGNGTVTDPTTGLTWMRCSMGQLWTGSACVGTPSTYTWAQAKALTGTVSFAGKNDWRLPNVRELQTIVDRSRINPPINTATFPNTPAGTFFSATPSVGCGGAWFVSFNWGDAGCTDGYNNAARLVRGGESFSALLNLARPTSDYVDHGNGTVTHTPTGLTWQRCAKGQNWTGSTCSGTATTFTWSVVAGLTDNFAGQSDWRLPTEEELLTLVDYTRSSPALNPTVFPATPAASNFWSSSNYVRLSTGIWSVYSDDGSVWYNYKVDPHPVRLVRSGTAPNTSVALNVALSGAGSGTVTSNPSGLNCGATCSTSFDSGSNVTLTAMPASGSSFTGWSGACTGTGACVVAMSAAQSVTATFAANATTALTGINLGASSIVVGGVTTVSPIPSGATLPTCTSSNAAVAVMLSGSVIQAVGTGATVISCGGAVTALVVTAPTAALTDLTLTCPTTIASGQTGTCNATAAYNDGTSKLVQVQWTSDNAALAIDSIGNITSSNVVANTPVNLTAIYTEGKTTLTRKISVQVPASPLGACSGNTLYTMLLTINAQLATTPIVMKANDLVNIELCMANFDGSTLLDVYVAAAIAGQNGAPPSWFVASQSSGLFATVQWSPWDMMSDPVKFMAKQAVRSVNTLQVAKFNIPPTLATGITTFYVQAVFAGKRLIDTSSWSNVWALGSASFDYLP